MFDTQTNQPIVGKSALGFITTHPSQVIYGNLNLSDSARQLIEDENNQRFLSIASLWEISIKVSIGKLELGIPCYISRRSHNIRTKKPGFRDLLEQSGDRVMVLPYILQ